MGIILIIASVMWAILAIAGLFYGLKFLERLQTDLGANLDLVIDSLDTVHSLIGESTDIVSSTIQSLDTVQDTMSDASIALSDLRPLVWRTKLVVTDDLPEALEGVQESMPSLIATAKSVDETLTWLSNFGFTVPNPFGPDWSYDFGIDYEPEMPLNQALETTSGNLEGLPEDLRNMKESLKSADDNLEIMSDDLAQLASDLEDVSQEIADINPQLSLLSEDIVSIQESFRGVQEKIPGTIKTARRIIIVVFGLILFTQIPALYLGLRMTSGIMPVTDIEERTQSKTT
jgi:hypothetical protein